jgi:hypothetical protein
MCLLFSFSTMLYLIPAALVFSTALQAFLEDETTPNNHFDSWVMLVVASVLWPLTLPCVVNRLAKDTLKSEQSDYPQRGISSH